MDQNQIFVLALANVPTMIAERTVDLRFDVLLAKIEEIANRLTRLEAQRG
jgi:hypothetical protein